VPAHLHFSKGRIKLEVGLGRGKLKHDKRADQREKEWNREKQRLLRSNNSAAADFSPKAGILGESGPGRNHGIGVERKASRCPAPSASAPGRVVGRALPADAHVLAVLAAGADRHGEHRLDRGVALVESPFGDQSESRSSRG
jgi:hypothetical protein